MVDQFYSPESFQVATPDAGLAATTDRLFYLDALKAFSITAVVSFHSLFIPAKSYTAHLASMEIIFAPLRFCVPVLLTISFLLLERSLSRRPEQSSGRLLQKRLLRLAIPAVFWFGVTALLKVCTGNSLLTIAQQLLTGNLFTGAYYFLILFQLIPLYLYLRSRVRVANLIWVGLATQLVVFGLMYILFRHGISSVLLSQFRHLDRAPFFYWMIYPILGAYLYHRLPSWHFRTLSQSFIVKGLVLLGLSLLFWFESSHLSETLHYNIPPFDYLLIACVLSPVVYFTCFMDLEENHVPRPWIGIIRLLSKYSLGIFCVNGILSQTLLSLGSRWVGGMTFSLPEVLLIKLIGWMVLLCISLGVSIMLDRAGLKVVVC
jgi:hypothetical protein